MAVLARRPQAHHAGSVAVNSIARCTQRGTVLIAIALISMVGSLGKRLPSMAAHGSWQPVASTPGSAFAIGMGSALAYAGGEYVYGFQGHIGGETPQEKANSGATARRAMPGSL